MRNGVDRGPQGCVIFGCNSHRKVLERYSKGARKVLERCSKGGRKVSKGVPKTPPRRPQGPFFDLGGFRLRAAPRVGCFVLSRNFGGLIPLTMSLQSINTNLQPHLYRGVAKQSKGGALGARPFWEHQTPAPSTAS